MLRITLFLLSLFSNGPFCSLIVISRLSDLYFVKQFFDYKIWWTSLLSHISNIHFFLICSELSFIERLFFRKNFYLRCAFIFCSLLIQLFHSKAFFIQNEFVISFFPLLLASLSTSLWPKFPFHLYRYTVSVPTLTSGAVYLIKCWRFFLSLSKFSIFVYQWLFYLSLLLSSHQIILLALHT